MGVLRGIRSYAPYHIVWATSKGKEATHGRLPRCSLGVSGAVSRLAATQRRPVVSVDDTAVADGGGAAAARGGCCVL